MGYIIKNEFGKFIRHNENGNIEKVEDESLAEVFESVGDAVAVCKLHVKKTNGFFVYDTKKKRVCYVAKFGRKSNKRKQWNEIDRRKIYDAANGRCELCGRKIEFEEMTVDHIIPLGRGGMDEFNNLQSACFACNQFKKNIHPEEFNKRITEIYLHQMEKRFGKLLRWKIVYAVLMKIA